MPTAVSYPGVYIEEVPSGVRTITAVPTSVTAFVGRARKGPTDLPVEITSYSEFERTFGGLWAESKLGYAVRDFYLNGGSRAVIARLFASELNEQERTDAKAGADAVATAAKQENTGKDAKTKANAALTQVNGEAGVSAAKKNAAAAVNEALAKLADDANKADVAAAADRAVAAAVPGDRAVITVGTLRFRARSQGKWGSNLRIKVERPVDKDGAAKASAKEPAAALGVDPADLFTLTVSDESPGGSSESFINLTVKPSVRRVDRVLEDQSKLIEWDGDFDPDNPPDLTDFAPDQSDAVWQARNDVASKKQAVNLNPTDAAKNELTGAQARLKTELEASQNSVSDGKEPKAAVYIAGGRASKTGLFLLEHLFSWGGIFNLLCIPPYKRGDVESGVLAEATAYCEYRRAMLLVDPPSAWGSVGDARSRFGTDADNLPRSRNAAVFFPRLRQPDPLQDGQIQDFAPCGLVAGICARTDAQRGVWKSPAGLDAALLGVTSLSVSLTDEENGALNPLGINCLRTFPVFGRVVWGARTLRGADDFADEYKYIAVRRTALFIEESLYRGLKWVVFEPNDEPLWAQIRLNVGAFMHNLFRQGAFKGAAPREAYFVQCDDSTTTQNDINLGIVNVNVGFAPLKPAEFVIIRLQQIAGQIET